MRIKFRLTYADFERAHREHAKSLHVWRIRPITGRADFVSHLRGMPFRVYSALPFIIMGVFAFAVIGIWSEWPLGIPKPPPWPDGTPMGKAAEKIMTTIVLPIALFIVYWIIKRIAIVAIAGHYKSAGDVRMNQTFEFDEVIIRRLQDRKQDEFDWTAYQRAIETPKLFLLYESDAEFHVLPKRAFKSPEEIDAFREFCHKYIGKPTGGFPIEAGKPAE